MSAAHWRRAMNTATPGVRVSVSTQAPANASPTVSRAPTYSAPSYQGTGWWSRLWAPVHARHWLVMAAVLLYPLVASPFFTYQIGAQSLALGLIALSLTFLGGYGGMVSLSQMTVAGLSSYLIAIFGTSSMQAISLGWPWWLACVFAILISVVFATLIGWLSVRTEGIHTIMITLAIGVAFFYLAQQNYVLFNGFQGFSKLGAPLSGLFSIINNPDSGLKSGGVVTFATSGTIWLEIQAGAMELNDGVSFTNISFRGVQ